MSDPVEFSKAIVHLQNQIQGLIKERDELRQTMLNFVGSLSLCDHMGDVWEDVFKLLELLKINIPDENADFDSLNYLGTYLGKHYGVTTLYGTPLYEEAFNDVQG